MGGHKGPIQAAGAVVFRDVDGTEGAREVLVVHRPDYDDFSLPKGKVERGEDLPITAVREVAEETGIDIRLSMPLQPTEYTVKYSTASGKPKRRAKVVSWWLGVAVGGSIEEATASPEEIDGAFWMPTDQALEQLSYPTDVQVLEEALELPSTSTIILVRHGKAVSRKEWSSRKKKTATDAKRPLERRGRRQARALIDLLGAFGVSHLVSSSSTRCMQTLKPYAENIGADIVAIDALSEEAHAADSAKTVSAMRKIAGRALSDPSRPVAVCGHRPVLPTMRDALGGANHPMSTAECLIVHLDEAGHTISQEWYSSKY
ncbi:MAG: NUDIX hydrolase [Cutibacterium avidum]|uniref:NUDIX hydrolase n=1 Tax=Cutibacterium avidum TaxID=33010 RepID=UPI00080FB689|nr:NUDIX hydrolase [Cutibacterium avidum]MBS5744586.1 NUDIX hydrolase [Propionibacterium sp.]MDK7360005.1 NUDIX hydrolase [Cutibacterium avidum]MDK7373223.1 NUDIX hydrolase [Cutibacterium avidum]MDU3726762.1 NUDIX hydrolase [Cutibacterium avidum]MDU3747623.1 NUDIX hydrolase [Cutibacterium avidum]